LIEHSRLGGISIGFGGAFILFSKTSESLRDISKQSGDSSEELRDTSK